MNAVAQQPPIPSDLKVDDLSACKSWLVYGNLGFASQTNNNTSNGTDGKYTNVNYNIGLGYNLDDHFTVGVQNSMMYSKTKVTFAGTSFADQNHNDSWTLGLFLRHTTCDFSKILFCFTQLNVTYYNVNAYPNGAYAASVYSNVTQDQIQNGYGLYANIIPSMGVRLPKNYALTLNFGGLEYSYLTQDHGNGTSSNINLTFLNEIKLGVQKEFNFRKSHMAKSFVEPDDEMHRRSYQVVEPDDEEGSTRKEGHKVHDMDDE